MLVILAGGVGCRKYPELPKFQRGGSGREDPDPNCPQLIDCVSNQDTLFLIDGWMEKSVSQ